MKLGPDDGDFKPSVLERSNDFVVSHAIAIIDAGAYYKEGVNQHHREALNITKIWNFMQTCVPVGLFQLNAQVHYPNRCPECKDCFEKALADSRNAIQGIQRSYEKCPKNKRAFTASYLPVVEVCFRRTKYLGTLR